MSSVPGKYERGSSWHLVFDRETFVIAPDGTVARKFSKYFNVVGADGKSRPFYEVMTVGKRRRTLHPAKATWHALEILTALGELKAT